MKNNWLITGGCGFIGINLVNFLLENKHAEKIRILDNLCVGKQEDLESTLIENGRFNKTSNDKNVKYDFENATYPSIELMIGDIRDLIVTREASRDMDIIVHLAANTGVAPSVETPRQDMEANVIGTFNMLEASRTNSVNQFVFASSGAPIGETEPPVHEEKVPKPVSPYGASKLAGEGYCSAYYRTFGIKTVILRFGNVYGPLSKHKDSVVAKFIKQALDGEDLAIYGDGNQTRDFIYIEDLVKAIILASELEKGGEVFQIATYKETTVNEIAKGIKELVEKVTGKKVNIQYGDFRIGDVMRNYSDISKAKSILGFRPEYDLKRGLSKTFEYFMYDKSTK